MSEYIGGPNDGESTCIPDACCLSHDIPWICSLKPKQDPGRYHLYLLDGVTGNYRYAGICPEILHTHYEFFLPGGLEAIGDGPEPGN